MKNLTLENITKVCNGIYHGPQEKLQEEVTAITTDSRKVEKGGLFVPGQKSPPFFLLNGEYVR